MVMIVTDTDLVSSAASHSYDTLSYVDAGLHSNPLQSYQLSRSAVTDTLPAGVLPGCDIRQYVSVPLDSSPSVITLLQDKLDSQSKASAS